MRSKKVLAYRGRCRWFAS